MSVSLTLSLFAHFVHSALNKNEHCDAHRSFGSHSFSFSNKTNNKTQKRERKNKNRKTNSVNIPKLFFFIFFLPFCESRENIFLLEAIVFTKQGKKKTLYPMLIAFDFCFVKFYILFFRDCLFMSS